MVESIARCGRVVSGRGKASSKLSGLREFFDYFGAEPQPGSLNIILDGPLLFRPERAKVHLDDHNIFAWPARMEGQACLVWRWRNCPLHVVEVTSPHRFQIQKGSRTLVEFDVADTAPIPLGRLSGWTCLWFLRRTRAYSDDNYFVWASKMAVRYPAWLGQQAV